MARGSAPGSLVAAALLLGLLALTLGCATKGGAYKGEPRYTERGLASWYGRGFHGKQAANGEIYDMHELTAAHRTLPFDTVVQVRNRDNGKRVEVRITDRGPFVKGRIIDLSKEAARQLDMLGPGVAPVEIRVLAGGPDTGKVSRYWVQFAKTGNPNGDGRPGWPRATAGNDLLLEFGQTAPIVRRNFRSRRQTFWDGHFDAGKL